MKKVMGAALAVAGLIASMQTAHAASEQGGYVGGQYNFGSVKFEDTDFGFSKTAKPTALTVLGGWNFNEYFAVEGRIGFGAGSDSLVAGLDVKVDSYFSALARGTFPVNEMFNVYGLLGLTSGKVKLEYDGGSSSSSDTGLAYGVGAEVNFAKQHGVSLEYAHLLKGSEDGTDYTITSISLGYRYRF